MKKPYEKPCIVSVPLVEVEALAAVHYQQSARRWAERVNEGK